MKKGLKLFATGFVAMTAMANYVSAESVKIGDKEYDTLKDAVDAVEVCTTETCEITTINVVEDHTTSGIKIASGKYITIDLGGYTVNFDEPTVGSTGTETQDMQILKDSTIAIKNGKMVSSDSEKSKMFIQNYANLTLENVEIDATNEQNLYAVSNNSGDVNIIGSTSIKAKKVAFDVCGYSTYTIGPKVVVNTTGTIEGDIEVTKDAKAANERPLSLLIKNANHIGNISIQEGLEDNVTIEKGTYTDEVANDVIEPAEGFGAYNTITKDGEYRVVVEEEAKVEEGYFGLGFTEEGFEEVFGEEEGFEEVSKLINEALGDKYKAAIYYELVYGDLINDNFVLGTEITDKLDNKVKVTLDVPKTIEELKEGYTRKYSVIRIHENDDNKFESSVLPATEKDGKVTFETDRFSTYVLAYEDVKNEIKTENPKTGDNMLTYFVASIISVVGLMLTTLKITKKSK